MENEIEYLYDMDKCSADTCAAFFSQEDPIYRRVGACVKSNMVYRMCNNMVYTLALGSPSKRKAFLRV